MKKIRSSSENKENVAPPRIPEDTPRASTSTVPQMEGVQPSVRKRLNFAAAEMLLLEDKTCKLPFPNEVNHLANKDIAHSNLYCTISFHNLMGSRGELSTRIVIHPSGANMNILCNPIDKTPSHIWLNTRDQMSRNIEVPVDLFVILVRGLLDNLRHFPLQPHVFTIASDVSISASSHGLTLNILGQTITIPFKGDKQSYTRVLQAFQKGLDALKVLRAKAHQYKLVKQYLHSAECKKCICKNTLQHLAAYHYDKPEQDVAELLPFGFIDVHNLTNPLA